jgi:hypothetical protein
MMLSVYLDFLQLSKEDQKRFLRKVLKKGGKKTRRKVKNVV